MEGKTMKNTLQMSGTGVAISVIIPCYNVEKYIDRCLDSLLAQTFPLDATEIICVDDKSTDDTLLHLRRYEEKYSGLIRVIEQSENGRQGRARNAALGEARGKWIAFVDSDDWVEPDYLERMYTCIGSGDKDFDVIQCGYDRDFSEKLKLFDREAAGNGGSPDGTGAGDSAGGSRVVRIITAETTNDHKRFVREQVLTYAVYSKLIRREFLMSNRIFFPEGLAYEDIYWGGLMNICAEAVCLIEDKLYHYFVNREATLLSAGAGYHTDMLTVQEQLWNEYIRRGLMETYGDEIRLEFVYSCALAFWKIIALRFEEPPYDLYQLLCTYTQTHIPDIWENSYVKQGALPEMYTLMLQSLFNPLGREQFAEFAKNIKTIGI